MFPRSQRALILTILIALGTCYYYFGLLVPESRRQDEANAIKTPWSCGGDFYPIWLTGRALLGSHINPYTREMTRQIQIGLYGRTMDVNRKFDQPVDYRAFAYPIYLDLLSAPLLPFSFNTVRLILAFLLAPLTALSVVLWLRVLGVEVSRSTLAVVMILVVVNYPVLEGLWLEQTALVVGFVLALSAYALVRGRLVVSGILLALSTVKPQMVWIFALFLTVWCFSEWKRRKAFFFGFAATLVVLFMLGEIVLPGWFPAWVHVLLGYSGYTLPSLPKLVLGRFLGPVLQIMILAFAAVMGWRARPLSADSAGFALSMNFVLVTTVVVHPTAGAVFDQVVMLPAIFWLWSRRKEMCRESLPLRGLTMVAVMALCWQWVTACALALVSLRFAAWCLRPSILVFPTRMAASFPFVVIALLALLAVRFLRER